MFQDAMFKKIIFYTRLKSAKLINDVALNMLHNQFIELQCEEIHRGKYKYML